MFGTPNPGENVAPEGADAGLVYQTVDKLLAVTKSWPLQAVTLSTAPKLYG